MKKHLASLSLAVAGLCAVPSLLRADDAVPPKPPGGDKAPPAAPAPSGGAAAQPGGPGGGGAARFSPEERLKRMTEALTLTQEQQDKIKAIMDKDAAQLKDLMAKGRDNLTEDDKNKFREVFKTEAEDIMALLTPEQKDKYKALLEKRRAGGGAGGAPKQ